MTRTTPPSSTKLGVFGTLTYRDGGALDVEALCVVGGEACWQVALNVSLLIDRGNALEAMTLGAAACLKHVRCRVATGTGDSVQLADVDSVVPLPLPLTRLPVAVPVVISGKCRTACVDPDCNEEAAAAASYIAGLDAHGELCFSQSCGVGLDPEALAPTRGAGQDARDAAPRVYPPICKRRMKRGDKNSIDLVRNT